MRKHIEAIAAIDGVDGIFIGPADLHASMGFAGETGNPAVLPLIDEALKRIGKAGKAPGILTGMRNSPVGSSRGSLFTAVGADVVVLARGADQLAAKFKQKA